MSRLSSFLGAVTLAAGLLTGMQATAADETLRIGYSVWVGYGPLFIADKKGFFEEEGLDVELVPIEDAKLRFASLAAGRIDLMATSVDAMPQYLKPSQGYRYIFGLDESSGADGVLVADDITDAAQLKGRRVAYAEGMVTEFILSAVLDKAGLTLKDVETVNMTAGDAGSAFATGQVEAAVTWEPYLTRGVQSGKGHRLTDTRDWPGLIADVMIARADRIDAQKDAIDRLYNAWAKAVAFADANPEEANAIMGAGLGGWLEDPAVIKDVMTGVTLMGDARNKVYFGDGPGKGEILPVIDRALDLWREQGKLQVDVKADDLVYRGAVH